MPYFRCDRCHTEYYSAASLTGTRCPFPSCEGTLKSNPFRDRSSLIDVSKAEGEGDSGA